MSLHILNKIIIKVVKIHNLYLYKIIISYTLNTLQFYLTIIHHKGEKLNKQDEEYIRKH